MKFVLTALLLAAPVFATQYHDYYSEARRARAEIRRDRMEARREVRRARTEAVREQRRARTQLRRATRQSILEGRRVERQMRRSFRVRRTVYL